MWLNPYEEEFYASSLFRMDIDRIWNEIKPFYQELHAYVKAKLIKRYNDTVIGDDGLIPAHILGREITLMKQI